MEKIVKKAKNTGKKSWIYRFFFMPKFYLARLFYATLFIGIINAIIVYFYYNSWLYEKFTIPETMHSVIGVVIGLVLVFRTNTAYDRWWSGRKNIETMLSSFRFFSAKLDVNVQDTEIKKQILNDIKYYLSTYLMYLKSKSQKVLVRRRNEYMKSIFKKLANLEKEGKLNNRQVSMLETALYDVVKAATSCETIKSTPIPMSLAMHAKTCILIYVLSLPFGLFHDLGYYSTPIIMLIFFMMAGIEIISNEIEDPFHGDPNDLPVEQLLNEVFDNVLVNMKTDEKFL